VGRREPARTWLLHSGCGSIREDALLPATPELIAEVAHDVMILSRGSERAIAIRALERGASVGWADPEVAEGSES